MSEERQKKSGNMEEEYNSGRKGEKQGSGPAEGTEPEVSETWAEETIAALDDFIESQGIYIRQ